jgi:hypothetical protein
VLKYVAFAIPVLFLAYVEGFLNPFWLWNSLPFGLGLGLLDRAKKNEKSPLPAVGFSIGAGVLSLFVHWAWLFDWREMATGGSTSALIFLFLPLYSLIPGALGYAIGRVIDLQRN